MLCQELSGGRNAFGSFLRSRLLLSLPGSRRRFRPSEGANDQAGLRQEAEILTPARPEEGRANQRVSFGGWGHQGFRIGESVQEDLGRSTSVGDVRILAGLGRLAFARDESLPYE